MEERTGSALVGGSGLFDDIAGRTEPVVRVDTGGTTLPGGGRWMPLTGGLPTRLGLRRGTTSGAASSASVWLLVLEAGRDTVENVLAELEVDDVRSCVSLNDFLMMFRAGRGATDGPRACLSLRGALDGAAGGCTTGSDDGRLNTGGLSSNVRWIVGRGFGGATTV